MFVLESCEGFQPGYIMWCCSMHQCNTVYTENDLLDLGFPIPYNLEYLTCHDRQTTGSTDTRPKYVLHLTIASVALVLGLLGVVLVVALRHRCTHGVGTKQSIERNGEPGTVSNTPKIDQLPLTCEYVMITVMRYGCLLSSHGWRRSMVSCHACRTRIHRLAGDRAMWPPTPFIRA